MFVIFEIFLAALSPAQRQFHGCTSPRGIRWEFGALVERHDNVRAQPDLYPHGAFRTEEMFGAIQVRSKRNAFLLDLAQLIQAEYLKAARVGENGARPRHEAVQSAQFSDLLDAGPQIEVISVGEKDLNAEFFQSVLGNALDRGQCADRHEDRSLDFAVRSEQASTAGGSDGGINFELKSATAGIVSNVVIKGIIRALIKLPDGFGILKTIFFYDFWLPLERFMISPEIFAPLTNSFPIVTGKLNRLGPALPGLK